MERFSVAGDSCCLEGQIWGGELGGGVSPTSLINSLNISSQRNKRTPRRMIGNYRAEDLLRGGPSTRKLYI